MRDCPKVYPTGHSEWDSGDVHHEHKTCQLLRDHTGPCGPRLKRCPFCGNDIHYGWVSNSVRSIWCGTCKLLIVDRPRLVEWWNERA